MAVTIKRIVLNNFKKFKKLSVDFNDGKNIIVGDNETGKSTILTAIDLVLSASISKIERFGLENLFNRSAIDEFLSLETRKRTINELPHLSIDVYLNGITDQIFEGKNNLEKTYDIGIRLDISPSDDQEEIINAIISGDNKTFPFEYYKIQFFTFAGNSYHKFNKIFTNILIDNSDIDGEYAKREYIKGVYYKTSQIQDRVRHQYNFRNTHDNFSENFLSEISSGSISFKVPSNNKFSLENQLQIYHENVNINNKGKGYQNLIKTKYALQKTQDTLNKLILIEEPENHLSATNMLKLLDEISKYTDGQMFITTHSNMITSRLGLENLFILSGIDSVSKLSDLKKDTSEFFIKAPNSNILNFVLSKKVILVEGHAEYILMEKFIKSTCGKMNNDVQIISVNGLSFKRYLEIAKITGGKTAVITDNDGDYTNNVKEKYSDYNKYPNIKIFSPEDNAITTFEKAIYKCNKDLCENKFGAERKDVVHYMLSNKSDCAFELLKSDETLIVPEYIRNGITWISV